MSTEHNTEARIALLIRHRWIADPVAETYVCTPGFSSLYKSYDPLCYGCGSVIPWSAIPRLERFDGVSQPKNRIMAEDLGVRLDLRICEIAVEQRPCWCAEWVEASRVAS